MNDRKHHDVLSGFVDFIDDDIWPFQQFSGSADPAGPSDASKPRPPELIDPRTNTSNYRGGRLGAVVRDPSEDRPQIGDGSFADQNLHLLIKLSMRALNSFNVKLDAPSSSRRRSTSRICSSVR